MWASSWGQARKFIYNEIGQYDFDNFYYTFNFSFPTFLIFGADFIVGANKKILKFCFFFINVLK